MRLLAAAALVAAALYIGARFVPPRADHAALQDRVDEECRFAGMPGRTAETIRQAIWGEVRARGLDAYLDEKDILVERGSSRVHVELAYVRPVELPGYSYPWRFEIDVTRVLY